MFDSAAIFPLSNFCSKPELKLLVLFHCNDSVANVTIVTPTATETLYDVNALGFVSLNNPGSSGSDSDPVHAAFLLIDANV